MGVHCVHARAQQSTLSEAVNCRCGHCTSNTPSRKDPFVVCCAEACVMMVGSCSKPGCCRRAQGRASTQHLTHPCAQVRAGVSGGCCSSSMLLQLLLAHGLVCECRGSKQPRPAIAPAHSGRIPPCWIPWRATVAAVNAARLRLRLCSGSCQWRGRWRCEVGHATRHTCRGPGVWRACTTPPIGHA